MNAPQKISFRPSVENLEERKLLNADFMNQLIANSPMAQAIGQHGQEAYGYNKNEILYGNYNNISGQSRLGSGLGSGFANPYQPSYFQPAFTQYNNYRQAQFQTMGRSYQNYYPVSYYQPYYGGSHYGLSPQTLYGLGGSYIGSYPQYY
ncbi:MAG: hypothetical protein AB7P49_19135 [Bdellovibrionales bacterium]